MTTGLLSWQIWIVAGALILAFACLEYAFRRTRAPDRPQPMTASIPPQSMPSQRLPPKPPAAPERGRVDETHRIFVGDDITPSYLVNLFKDNTNIEATTQTNRFLGKWMKVEGAINDITTIGANIMCIVLEPKYEGDISRDFLVFLYFDETWIENISILRRGNKVTVICKIDMIDSVKLKLEDCELKD
jgi:hypothetical protein